MLKIKDVYSQTCGYAYHCPTCILFACIVKENPLIYGVSNYH
jgi:hypothetical protein